ncbi:MAG: NosD domain-containing protein [Thermoplasmata archaeon]
MRRRSLAAVILIFLGTFSLAFSLLPDSAQAITHYVGGGGPGNYTTIQAAVNAANAGDIIYVFGGTYSENVIVSKSLSLIGEDKQATIIDAGSTGSAVTITSDSVNISGFTLTNSGSLAGDAGVILDSVHYCTITDVITTGNTDGIFLFSSGTNTISLVETYSNFWSGIVTMFSSSNVIDRNNVHSNFFGITLDRSSSNKVRWNNVTDNFNQITLSGDFANVIAYNNISDGSRGIWLDDSENAIIKENNISSHTLVGIRFQASLTATLTGNAMVENGIHIEGDSVQYWNTHDIDDSNTVNGKPVYYWKDATGGMVPSDAGQVILANSANVIVQNQNITNTTTGIQLGFSSGNTIANNTIWYSNNGIHMASSAGNWVYHNDFFFNSAQAYDGAQNNIWDNGYPSGGNYWSDYAGLDQFSGPNQDQPGSDGIGDTPRTIDAADEDRYPLMSPYSTSVPPEPPTLLFVNLSGKDWENVTLTWSLSPDDGSGLESVVGYRIYRNVSYNPQGLGYSLIATLPNQTSVFVDNLSGEGDPSDYFYRVCAFDGYGKAGCSDDQAAKFTRPLAQGPNLVSVPLIQSNESIEAVLRTVDYDETWYYDSSSQEWKWYMASKGYRRGLWNMDHTMGLWVNVTGDCNLTVAGIVPSQTTMSLREGWNLVGFPSFNASYAVSDLKAEVGAVRVEGYISMPPFTPYMLEVLGDGVALGAGFGYWVKVVSDIVWVLDAI